MSFIEFLAVYVITCMVCGLFAGTEDEHNLQGLSKAIYEWWVIILEILLTILTIGLVFWVLGWVWYFICGGGLIAVMESFWDKVMVGLIATAFLIFLLGGIAKLFGK